MIFCAAFYSFSFTDREHILSNKFILALLVRLFSVGIRLKLNSSKVHLQSRKEY